VKHTRRALGMLLFPFSERITESTTFRSKLPQIPPPKAEGHRHFCPPTGPHSILPITRFLRGHFVNVDSLCSASEKPMIASTTQNNFFPRERSTRNMNPRPADEAGETGLGASVFHFPKQETPKRGKRWPVLKNEMPAKIVLRFCCFITDVFQLL